MHNIFYLYDETYFENLNKIPDPIQICLLNNKRIVLGFYKHKF